MRSRNGVKKNKAVIRKIKHYFQSCSKAQKNAPTPLHNHEVVLFEFKGSACVSLSAWLLCSLCVWLNLVLNQTDTQTCSSHPQSRQERWRQQVTTFLSSPDFVLLFAGGYTPKVDTQTRLEQTNIEENKKVEAEGRYRHHHTLLWGQR